MCLPEHMANLGHASIIHITKFAEEVILPAYQAELGTADKKVKEFAGTQPELRDSISKIVNGAEVLVNALESIVTRIKSILINIKSLQHFYEDESSFNSQKTKENLEQKIASLKNSISENNLTKIAEHCIAEKEESKQLGDEIKIMAQAAEKEIKIAADTLSNVFTFTSLSELNKRLDECKDLFHVNSDGNVLYIISNKKIFLYNLLNKESKIIKTDFLTESEYYGSCIWKNKIYIAGGTNNPGLKMSGVCEVKENLEIEFTQLADMQEAKCVNTLVMIDSNSVYTIGGYQTAPKSFCEKYDVKSNTWTKISSLNEPKYNVTAITNAGKYIFCIGGHGCTQGNMIEKYDTEKMSGWEPISCSDMINPCGDSGSYSVVSQISENDYIILCGSMCWSFDLSKRTLKKSSKELPSEKANNQANAILLMGKMYSLTYDSKKLICINSDTRELEDLTCIK